MTKVLGLTSLPTGFSSGQPVAYCNCVCGRPSAWAVYRDDIGFYASHKTNTLCAVDYQEGIIPGNGNELEPRPMTRAEFEVFQKIMLEGLPDDDKKIFEEKLPELELLLQD